jgi:hypothetical protein
MIFPPQRSASENKRINLLNELEIKKRHCECRRTQ